MADVYNTVDIWLCEFASAQRMELFFSERIDPDDDQSPISQFAAAMKEPFYDHDYLEKSYRDAPTSVASLLRPHSFSASFIDEAAAAADSLAIHSANSTVLIWNREIPCPVSVEGEGHSLKYIGRFRCDPSTTA